MPYQILTGIFELGSVPIALQGVSVGEDLADVFVRSTVDDAIPELVIQATARGLECCWHSAPDRRLQYFIDVDKFTGQFYSFPAPKQGAFNQALGNKTRHVVDATAGWGGDTLLMAAQGYKVSVLERNPVMFLLLRDAMRRLANTDWARNNGISAPTVIYADSIQFLQTIGTSADCIYLDPMFPPKRKKSASVNKNMQLLQWLVGADADAPELASAALHCGCPRVVIKRPVHAQPLSIKPCERFTSKLLHYDVYLRAGR